MVWQPGQSGNPTGEGRKGKAEKLAELASIYSRSAINTIAGIMENPEAKHADRLTAARMLLDRAVGTPVQAVNVSSNLTVSLVELLATLPSQGPKLTTIEHEQEPPPMVAGISLQQAAEAAAELEQGKAAQGLCSGLEREILGGDARPAGETVDQVEEEEGELILRPANDDLGGTQPGGE
jgi:hypothetical protein